MLHFNNFKAKPVRQELQSFLGPEDESWQLCCVTFGSAPVRPTCYLTSYDDQKISFADLQNASPRAMTDSGEKLNFIVFHLHLALHVRALRCVCTLCPCHRAAQSPDQSRLNLV